MDRNQSNRPRRWFLEVAGSASMVGAAGCFAADESNGVDDESDADDGDDQACIEELEDSLPAAYDTAVSIDGIERDPNDLVSKEDAGYQCSPSQNALCANCRFFVLGQDGHRLRACTVVEGEIASQHWCGYYQPTERLDDQPNPLPHD